LQIVGEFGLSVIRQPAVKLWVVSPGDPAANAYLFPNAASANTAGPVPSRLLRLSSVMTLLPWSPSRVTGHGDPGERGKIHAMPGGLRG
jgi:hypothetical protein